MKSIYTTVLPTAGVEAAMFTSILIHTSETKKLKNSETTASVMMNKWLPLTRL